MHKLKLSVFESYLLAVVAMDRDYEPLGTVQPFMAARFGSRAYPRAIVRALKALETRGLVRTYCYSPSRSKDRYIPRPISLRPRNLWRNNAWFRATSTGLAQLKALSVRVEI